MNQRQQQVFLSNRPNLLGAPSIFVNSILTSRFCIKMSLAWNFIFESPGGRRLHLLLRVALPLRIRHESKVFLCEIFLRPSFSPEDWNKKVFSSFSSIANCNFPSFLFLSRHTGQDLFQFNHLSFNLGLLSIPRTKGCLTYENGTKRPQKSQIFVYLSRNFLFPRHCFAGDNKCLFFSLKTKSKEENFFSSSSSGDVKHCFQFCASTRALLWEGKGG